MSLHQRLLMVLAAAMLGAGIAQAQQKPIVWNLPHIAAPTYYHMVNLNAFAAKVKEKSQGRMEIRVHPASSLYPGPELIPAVLDGRAEIGPILANYLTDVFLELGVSELPFMTRTTDQHRRVAEALRQFSTETMAKRGVKLLTIHAWPSQQIFSAQPIRTVADWKGKKMRVYGAESADLVRVLGGAPTNIAFGELYTALQRGMVDGAMTSATNAEPMKFFEVSKYINYWYLSGAATEWLVANQKAWSALPADLQQIVLDSLKEVRFEDKEWEDTKALDERTRTRAVELGMTLIDPSNEEIAKARQLARPAWDTWIKRTGGAGQRALDIANKALAN